MALILYDLCGRDADLRFSPHCWRARMALAHKGLDFATQPTPFTAVAAVEGGVSKIVPVINDGGRIVSDSFDIALYLDDAYPDRPTLFDGDGGKAGARFLEAWAFHALHPIIMRMMVKDIHDVLGDRDQAYFRPSREARLGRPLEEHQTGVDANAADLQKSLEPARRALLRYPWLGGLEPRYADYTLLGTLMWLRTITGQIPLADADPVLDWLKRCLELHGGMAGNVKTARAATP